MREVCCTEDQVVIDDRTRRFEETIECLRSDVRHSVTLTGQTEECIQGLAQAVDQVKSLNDIEGVLRKLHTLRKDVYRLSKYQHDPRTVAAAPAAQPQVATQPRDVVDLVQSSSQVTQDKLHFDAIVDSKEKNSSDRCKNSRKARTGLGPGATVRRKARRAVEMVIAVPVLLSLRTPWLSEKQKAKVRHCVLAQDPEIQIAKVERNQTQRPVR